MIKLLSLDLDGTVLDSRGRVPAENLRAIKAAEEQGVLVTIATGRRFRDALHIALQLDLNAPLITHNGALIKYADSLETVAVSLIESDVACEVVKVGKKYDGDALVSADPVGKGTLYYDRISHDNVPLQRYIVWAETMHGKEAHDAVHHVDSLEEMLNDHKIIHISFSGSCASMVEMENVLKAELAAEVTFLPTIYPKLDFTLLDILPFPASKGHGVEQLAKLNNITADEVMVIGDNFNDLEMLQYAGTPVVMGNAEQDLFEQGNFYRTLENDANGVAHAIERFILNPQ